jgi:hypothetical protein
MKLSVPTMLLLGMIAASSLHAQSFLKKVKDKVSGKTENSNDNNNKPAETEKPKAAWCDTELGNGGASGTNGASSGTSNTYSNVSYKLAFSSPTGFTILYDESCLGIGASKSDYRLILSQYVDKKTQYIIIDNGKITATVKEITNKELICGIHPSVEGFNSGGSKTDNQKYIVPINTTTTVAAQDSKTITTAKKIDADKVATGYEMAKNTEEYKKLSPEEKKQMDEMMKQMPQMAKDYNNSGLAGKTFTTPETKGGTYTIPTGYYNIIVKGKNYGKFLGQPTIAVSEDEANVYLVATDEKNKASFIVNDKKFPLGGNNGAENYHNGQMLLSPDGKRAAYIELKQLTAKEQEEMIKVMQTGAAVNQTYFITKSNGTSLQVNRKSDSGDKFRITNSGAIVYVDAKTGEVVADGKSIGKFPAASTDYNSGALLLGNDPSKLCYYNEDGSLSYLDGSKKDMGILFPRVITENGKNFIAWFRKCKNDIYIGKFEF